MQTVVVEKLALTFISDAYALMAGAGEILVGIVTAPIERIARACDVGGVLSSRKRSRPRCPFWFSSLKHLT